MFKDGHNVASQLKLTLTIDLSLELTFGQTPSFGRRVKILPGMVVWVVYGICFPGNEIGSS